MPIISFNQTSKIFQPAGDGVFEITFTVDPGELVFITGPSGAGKTTLLRLVTKEYEPTTGEIEFAGAPLTTVKKSQLHLHRRRIGVVYQDYRLITERNIWENVALPLFIVGEKRQTIEQRVTDLLTLVGLSEKALLFPSQLSGGEAQRVGIARALALAPEVIFADEPTGNLDEQTSLAISRLLVKIRSLGTTVLFATHDPTVLKEHQAERLLRMEKGRVVIDTKDKKPAAKPEPEKEAKKNVTKKEQS